jgi:hypothetical protein
MLVTWLLVALPAQAERRVALVMGNGLYKSAVQLPNPPADAEAMAVMLSSMGFEVVVGTNLGRDAMTDKMSRFAQLAGGADVALFFYAGHGFQLEGKNLLVPVDADIKSELDAKVRTIEIDSVLHHTMSDAKVKLVLLDACRDNPFAKQIASTAPKTRNIVVGSGLAEMRPGEGTLIAFATGPGQVALDGEGKHSPFTRALLAHVSTPGVEIRHALTRVRAQVSDDTRKQQLPWENTNMTGFFYMKKQEGTGADTQVLASTGGQPASSFDPRALELELWSSIKGSSNADDFKAYLDKFPNGTFADVARTRIAGLSRPSGLTATPTSTDSTTGGGDLKTAEASSATEDALGLSREAWKDVQRRLTGLGFGTRSTDGRVGEGTRKGLRSWQSARGYSPSGYLNRLQHEALLREVVALAPAGGSGSGSDENKVRRNRPSGGGGGTGGGDGGGAIAGEVFKGIVREVIRPKLPF